VDIADLYDSEAFQRGWQPGYRYVNSFNDRIINLITQVHIGHHSTETGKKGRPTDLQKTAAAECLRRFALIGHSIPVKAEMCSAPNYSRILVLLGASIVSSLGIAGVRGRYGGILVVLPPKYPHISSLTGDSQSPVIFDETLIFPAV